MCSDMDEMKIMVLNLEQFMNDAYIAKVNQKDQRTRVSGSERLSEDIATPSCYMRGKEKDSKKYKTEASGSSKFIILDINSTSI